MATDNSELTFIRCPQCRSLIPSVSTRCRMCGASLDSVQQDENSEASQPTGRVRQLTSSDSDSELQQVKEAVRNDFSDKQEFQEDSVDDPLSAYVEEMEIDLPEEEYNGGDAEPQNVQTASASEEAVTGGDDFDISDYLDDMCVEEDEAGAEDKVAMDSSIPEEETPAETSQPAFEEEIPLDEDFADFLSDDEEETPAFDFQENEEKAVLDEPEATPSVEETASVDAEEVPADVKAEEEEPVKQADVQEKKASQEGKMRKSLFDKNKDNDSRRKDRNRNKNKVREESNMLGTIGGSEPEHKVVPHRDEIERGVKPSHKDKTDRREVERNREERRKRREESRRPVRTFEEDEVEYNNPQPVTAQVTTASSDDEFEVRKSANTKQKPIENIPNMKGRLFGWLVNYNDPNGDGIELREGRFFVSRRNLKDNDLILDDPSISTPHAIVMIGVEEGLRIQDLMSERGFFVRRFGADTYQRENEVVTLENGDWVRFGDIEFLVSLIPYVGQI